MSGGSPVGEIEPWGIHPVILTIDTVKNGKYARHRGSGYKMGGDSRMAFLSRNVFFHEPDISFLLLYGVALGS